mmetsp:Transcript_18100/g.42018  ORF Transcript_18100/g.42018 Transcript_18100/m.42018 type:complete len:566 (+) Transcript_18100:10353-12050(+)
MADVQRRRVVGLHSICRYGSDVVMLGPGPIEGGGGVISHRRSTVHARPRVLEDRPARHSRTGQVGIVSGGEGQLHGATVVATQVRVHDRNGEEEHVQKNVRGAGGRPVDEHVAQRNRERSVPRVERAIHTPRRCSVFGVDVRLPLRVESDQHVAVEVESETGEPSDRHDRGAALDKRHVALHNDGQDVVVTRPRRALARQSARHHRHQDPQRRIPGTALLVLSPDSGAVPRVAKLGVVHRGSGKPRIQSSHTNRPPVGGVVEKAVGFHPGRDLAHSRVLDLETGLQPCDGDENVVMRRRRVGDRGNANRDSALLDSHDHRASALVPAHQVEVVRDKHRPVDVVTLRVRQLGHNNLRPAAGEHVHVGRKRQGDRVGVARVRRALRDVARLHEKFRRPNLHRGKLGGEGACHDFPARGSLLHGVDRHVKLVRVLRGVRVLEREPHRVLDASNSAGAGRSHHELAISRCGAAELSGEGDGRGAAELERAIGRLRVLDVLDRDLGHDVVDPTRGVVARREQRHVREEVDLDLVARVAGERAGLVRRGPDLEAADEHRREVLRRGIPDVL